MFLVELDGHVFFQPDCVTMYVTISLGTRENARISKCLGCHEQLLVPVTCLLKGNAFLCMSAKQAIWHMFLVCKGVTLPFTVTKRGVPIGTPLVLVTTSTFWIFYHLLSQ